MGNYQEKLRVMEKYGESMAEGLGFNFYFPDEISQKQLNNAKAKFASGLDKNTVLGFYDTTVMGSGKNGYIFTDEKMYYLETLEKPKKFWYEDIVSVDIYNYQRKKDYNRSLEITLNDGTVLEMTGTLINKTPVQEFLNEIVKLDKKVEANNGQNFYPENENLDAGTIAGMTYGNRDVTNKLYDEERFNARQGHGFAAERANNLYDKLQGHDAEILGDDNVLNGADRIVDGIEIQSKYCKTGSRCVNECFTDGGKGAFRYYTQDGKPMQIEVPSDKYEAAVLALEEKIRRGQISGVSDPNEAKNIVRKGHFTYEQARNIAKAGTVESITYDAVNGAVIAASTFGVTAALSFATNIWNGEDIDVALRQAATAGIKVGSTAFITTILTGQLSKSGLNGALVGTTDTIIAIMGPKASAVLVNAFRSGKNIYGAAAMKSASKLLRGNVITAGISMVVLSSVDIANIFSGRISGKQLFKNLTTTASGIAGGSAGWVGGAAGGAAIGSVIPVIGTATGAIIGGIIGSVGGGMAAGKASDVVMGSFIEDDAEEMVHIIQKRFEQLAKDYLLNGKEAEKVADRLKEELSGKILKDMFASSDRNKFADDLLRPLMDEMVSKRKYIKLPTDTQMVNEIRNILEETYDVAGIS